MANKSKATHGEGDRVGRAHAVEQALHQARAAEGESNPPNEPIAASSMPCFKISFCTSESCAPSAMRNPISRVRPATTCDITP